jgi:hypothetical protein
MINNIAPARNGQLPGDFDDEALHDGPQLVVHQLQERGLSGGGGHHRILSSG